VDGQPTEQVAGKHCEVKYVWGRAGCVCGFGAILEWLRFCSPLSSSAEAEVLRLIDGSWCAMDGIWRPAADARQ